MTAPGTEANPVLAALEARGNAFGTWVQTNSPEACQAAAATGFDFVVIDMQHGALSLSDAATMIAAVRAHGSAAVVRLPDSSPALVGHLLDAGADGVLVPDVKTAEGARAAVAAATYAPAGTRGACPTTIASRHGVTPWAEYRAAADSQRIVWALIEHPDAVDRVDEIAASGVHALVLGPFDLSLAMGLDGDVDHPLVRAALERVTKAASAAGIETVSVLFDEVAGVRRSARQWQEAGCRILTASSDRWALTQGFAGALRGLRDTD